MVNAKLFCDKKRFVHRKIPNYHAVRCIVFVRVTGVTLCITARLHNKQNRTIICVSKYAILLITTDYRWCMTTLAVSDKCIREWPSISRSLQGWGLVYWEATCLVWSLESVLQQPGALVHAWCTGKYSHQQPDRCTAATIWGQDMTVIVLCIIHFHPWLHKNHFASLRLPSCLIIHLRNVNRFSIFFHQLICKKNFYVHCVPEKNMWFFYLIWFDK